MTKKNDNTYPARGKKHTQRQIDTVHRDDR